jgi:nicotinamidase/pyrazinamidase
MTPPSIVLWCVDAQKDFMLPGGKLYVPGAEKLLPNIGRLVDIARAGKSFLVSHGCFHVPDDPEFSTFPPHCIRGTAGADFVSEAMTSDYVRIPNDPSAVLPEDFLRRQQIVLEKQTLDIFESRHADDLAGRLSPDADFVVFGVVTEYCVGFAAKGLIQRGRRVTIVSDAIETLDRATGDRAVAELRSLGVDLTTTDRILNRLIF